MKRWKATLWHTPIQAGKAVGVGRPLDTVLLTKRCHTTAEDIFFNKRKWDRQIDYHIEIEKEPRHLSKGA